MASASSSSFSSISSIETISFSCSFLSALATTVLPMALPTMPARASIRALKKASKSSAQVFWLDQVRAQYVIKLLRREAMLVLNLAQIYRWSMTADQYIRAFRQGRFVDDRIKDCG